MLCLSIITLHTGGTEGEGVHDDTFERPHNENEKQQRLKQKTTPRDDRNMSRPSQAISENNRNGISAGLKKSSHTLTRWQQTSLTRLRCHKLDDVAATKTTNNLTRCQTPPNARGRIVHTHRRSLSHKIHLQMQYTTTSSIYKKL